MQQRGPTMPDDETKRADAADTPAGRPSRRQAFGVMGLAVSAGVAGASMPAQGAPARPAAVYHEPTPPPLEVPRGDLVDVLEYEGQARFVLGAGRVAPILGSDRSVTERHQEPVDEIGGVGRRAPVFR